MTAAVFRRTRGLMRRDDYRWQPFEPDRRPLSRYDGLYAEEEPSLLCVVEGGFVTLQLTGLETRRTDEVGTAIWNTLVVTGAAADVGDICASLCQEFLITEVPGASATLGNVTEGLPEQSPDTWLESLQTAIPGAELKDGESMDPLPFRAALGNVTSTDHRRRYLSQVRRALLAFEGSAVHLTYASDPEELVVKLSEPDSPLFVLGVGLGEELIELRWMHSAEVAVTPGKDLWRRVLTTLRRSLRAIRRAVSYFLIPGR